MCHRFRLDVSFRLGSAVFLKAKITELYTLYVVFTLGQSAAALCNRNMYGFPCIACPVQSRLLSIESSGIVLRLRIFAF
jgi:hypothetical protein